MCLDAEGPTDSIHLFYTWLSFFISAATFTSKEKTPYFDSSRTSSIITATQISPNHVLLDAAGHHLHKAVA